MTDAIRQAVKDILGACHPLEIILYAEKRTMSTGKLKAFSLCVIAPEGTDCRSLRTRLHLVLSADVPVSLSVYTTEEWDRLRAGGAEKKAGGGGGGWGGGGGGGGGGRGAAGAGDPGG